MPGIVPSQVVQVIEKYFPKTKDKNQHFDIDRGHRNECVSISRLINQIPSELLNPSNSDNYSILISNIEMLDFNLEIWKTQPKTSIDNITGKNNPNPISVIHDILLECPDEAIASKTAELNFIKDVALRDSLRLDLSSANNALSNGEWKASTVLAGSITEALLLWAINKVKSKKQAEIKNAIEKYSIKERDFNKWSQAQYNEISKEISIIQDRT